MVSVVYNSPDKTSKDPLDYPSWLVDLSATRSPADIARLEQACQFSVAAHAGQQRASGEPYFQHVLAVANILASLRLDTDTLIAALLHDVVEDTQITLEAIATQFGVGVAKLVDGVTKMEAIAALQGAVTAGGRDHANAESLRKMLLAMVEDVRVVLIKLADRTHNMRTLGALSSERQKRIAKETMEIFAPLANRLGIWQMKWELEDLSFRYLQPDLYKQIAKLLNERRIDREQYIQDFMLKLKTMLDEVGISAVVTGRPKHIYSIYRKMLRKDMDYTQIYDVRAVRVLVDEIKDCYAALGVVHSQWQYVPGEFDDYIANPKSNNYKSLHTAIIGPEGKTVEVQIRTNDMHQHSELGIAAHWRYKEGKTAQGDGFEKKIAWLRQLLEWKDEVRDAGDFVANVKSDIFEDRIYVFTPKGEVVDLIHGATPLDFAYHIHTQLGHSCRGAKVNGRMVSLTYSLQTGEQVEVLTVKRGEPSRDWLNPALGYLKSVKARAKVQAWFKQQNFAVNAQEGRADLERELQRLGLKDVNFEKLARQLNFTATDEFFAAVGRADLRMGQVIAAWQRLSEPQAKVENELPFVSRPATNKSVREGDVHILGVGNVLTHFAQCCKAVPGDEIAGYITRGRGVTIHRSDCPNVLRYREKSPERLISVSWGARQEKTYPVTIQIVAYDRQGLLRDVSGVFTNEEVNVIGVNTQTNPRTHLAHMKLTVEINNIEKLSMVIAKLAQLPNVQEVRREVG